MLLSLLPGVMCAGTHVQPVEDTILNALAGAGIEVRLAGPTQAQLPSCLQALPLLMLLSQKCSGTATLFISHTLLATMYQLACHRAAFTLLQVAYSTGDTIEIIWLKNETFTAQAANIILALSESYRPHSTPPVWLLPCWASVLAGAFCLPDPVYCRAALHGCPAKNFATWRLAADNTPCDTTNTTCWYGRMKGELVLALKRKLQTPTTRPPPPHPSPYLGGGFC